MSKMPVPFIFYARKQNVLSVKVSETEKQRCTVWYNGVSSEEANQKVCTAKGVRGMQKKSCIGVVGKGKCNGERLHSLKYNSRKKYYCLDCFIAMCNLLKARDSRVGLGI
jgi:hypothetical protein